MISCVKPIKNLQNIFSAGPFVLLNNKRKRERRNWKRAYGES